MFTGIIKEVGMLMRKLEKSDGNFELEIESKTIKPTLGCSIAVNGICLTVSKITSVGFIADAIPETMDRTNLKYNSRGSKLNLEPSVKVGDSLDGHFVTGHVDDIGIVNRISESNSSDGITTAIKINKKISPFIAEKGSITVNGVSLTVSKRNKDTFEVALIPFTYKNTNLCHLKPEDKVNIEIDILARYCLNKYL